ncbi:MAG: alpha/beta hydrolase [Isosphaeraceae bacterium]
MRIELISRFPAAEARQTPLLFVHGSYCGAWVWDRHFLPFFASQGFTSHALSLRGHGASDGREALAFHRLRDYVADLESVLETFETPPVLVGHSMGGMVVQKVMHRRALPATVLMAPVPPHGLLGSFLGIALRNPMLLHEMAWAQTSGPTPPEAARNSAVRRALFSDETPEEEAVGYLARFQRESAWVVLDLLGFDLPPSLPRLDLPVLVVGAERDGFVFPDALDATARTYRTRAEVLPGVSHAMMLDRGWEGVARHILGWLDQTLAA